MNDTTLIDAMVGALSDPFDDCHMGVTAEAKLDKSQRASRRSIERERRAQSAGHE